MADFNNIFLSPQWLKEYHTKYPHGLSVMENLIEWVNQVNELIDYVNITPDTLESKLIEWKNDGTLDNIIADALLKMDNYIVANDDSVELQSLINSAAGKPIKLTKDFNINVPLVCPSNLKLYTDKILQGNINATAPMTAMLKFTDFRRGSIEGVGINGHGLADKGIEVSGTMEHSFIKENYITNTLSDGIYIRNGWCNTIIDNEIVLNGGNGIQIDSSIANNIYNIIRNRIYHNNGMGIKINFASAVNISENTIEMNKICGIFAVYNRGLNIKDNYFEANSEIGWGPDLDKADIILNGEYSNSFSRLYPNKNVTIADNTTSSDGVAGKILVYPIAVDGLIIEGNSLSGSAPVTLFKIINNNGVSLSNRISVGFNVDFTEWSSIGTYINKDNRQNTHTWKVDEASEKNYFNKSLGSLVIQETIQGVISESALYYNNEKGIVIDGVSSGYSSVWGQKIDLSKCPELKGKTVTMTAAVYTTPGIVPVLYINGRNTNYSYIEPGYNNKYSLLSTHYKMPDSGEITVGLSALSSDINAKCHFFNPELIETGGKTWKL